MYNSRQSKWLGQSMLGYFPFSVDLASLRACIRLETSLSRSSISATGTSGKVARTDAALTFGLAVAQVRW